MKYRSGNVHATGNAGLAGDHNCPALPFGRDQGIGGRIAKRQVFGEGRVDGPLKLYSWYRHWYRRPPLLVNGEVAGVLLGLQVQHALERDAGVHRDLLRHLYLVDDDAAPQALEHP